MAQMATKCAAARQRAPDAVVPRTVRQNAATMNAVQIAGTTELNMTRLMFAEVAVAVRPNATSIQRLYGTCPANQRSSAGSTPTLLVGAEATIARPTIDCSSTAKAHDNAAVATRPRVTRCTAMIDAITAITRTTSAGRRRTRHPPTGEDERRC